MRNIIAKKVSWPEMDNLDPVAYEINQWIETLDRLNVETEARWGVDVLPQLVPADTAQKWQRHLDKINQAIDEKNLDNMKQLVEGARRGISKMEADAVTAGHLPHNAPVAWTVAMPDGRVLAIVKTHRDASVLQGKHIGNTEMVIWSLEEVANFICAGLTKTYGAG